MNTPSHLIIAIIAGLVNLVLSLVLRMVVRQDHRAGIAGQRALDHLARVDARLAQRAGEQRVQADQPVLAVEEQHRKHGDQHEAELVDRGHLRRFTHLQGPEVADPRRPGGKPREHQKQKRFRGQRHRVRPLPGREHEGGQNHRDDAGPHERRQIGINSREPDLREDGRHGCEHGRKQRPEKPRRTGLHSLGLLAPCLPRVIRCRWP